LAAARAARAGVGQGAVVVVVTGDAVGGGHRDARLGTLVTLPHLAGGAHHTAAIRGACADTHAALTDVAGRAELPIVAGFTVLRGVRHRNAAVGDACESTARRRRRGAVFVGETLAGSDAGSGLAGVIGSAVIPIVAGCLVIIDVDAAIGGGAGVGGAGVAVVAVQKRPLQVAAERVTHHARIALASLSCGVALTVDHAKARLRLVGAVAAVADVEGASETIWGAVAGDATRAGRLTGADAVDTCRGGRAVVAVIASAVVGQGGGGAAAVGADTRRTERVIG